MARHNKQSKKNSPPSQHCRLGGSVRALRKDRRLTLAQLSQMAGVSKAMLSQVEQDKVNPTVAVMIKISNALRVSVGELLDDQQAHNIIRTILHSEDLYTFRSDDACNIRTLSPLELEKTVEFYRITLEPDGEMASEAHFPGTEEILHLAKGRLEVISGGQSVTLSKGDSIHYRADVPHCLRNCGRGRAEAYMIVRYRQD